MKEHFKNNYIIYLLIILIVAITLAIKLVPKNKEELLDTSMFNVIDVKEALQLFNESNNKAKVLLICRLNCSACINSEKTFKFTMLEYKYNINYLELSNLQNDNEETKQLLEKLDYEYTLNDKKDVFSNFLGVTPMFIIIKNNKMVYGNIGTMDKNQIKQVVTKYDVTNE